MNPAVECVSSPSRPSERLPLEAGSHVIGQRDELERRPEHELAGVQDERLICGDVDQVREFRLIHGRIDERVLVVVEESEVPVEAHVDARGLDHLRIPRVEADSARVDLESDVTVGEQHRPSLAPVFPGDVARSAPVAREPERFTTRA